TMFFFSSIRRHTRWPRDWSSDVCSSDLNVLSAVPIPESTFPCGEGPALERGALEAFDAHQALGDLLPIGAHVLYRRAADRARNEIGRASEGKSGDLGGRRTNKKKTERKT